MRDGCGATISCGVSAGACRGVELGHELAVRGPCRGEVLVAFFELKAQVDGLLLKVSDLLVERDGVGRNTEPGFVPCLFAECFGQSLLELPDAGAEPDGAFSRGEQVGLQRGTGDGWPGPAAGGAAASRACSWVSRSRCRQRKVRSTPAARAIWATVISVPLAAARLSTAMTRCRRRAESACRPFIIASVRGPGGAGRPVGVRVVMRGPLSGVIAGRRCPGCPG